MRRPEHLRRRTQQRCEAHCGPERWQRPGDGCVLNYESPSQRQLSSSVLSVQQSKLCSLRPKTPHLSQEAQIIALQGLTTFFSNTMKVQRNGVQGLDSKASATFSQWCVERATCDTRLFAVNSGSESLSQSRCRCFFVSPPGSASRMQHSSPPSFL